MMGMFKVAQTNRTVLGSLKTAIKETCHANYFLDLAIKASLNDGQCEDAGRYCALFDAYTAAELFCLKPIRVKATAPCGSR